MTLPEPAPSPPSMQWLPERFMWAELPAHGWRRAGPPPPGVIAELEDEFPIPTHELHVVCCPVDGGRLVVCAARVDELAALEGQPSALTPSAPPTGVSHDIDLSRLNLLVGAFEPRSARRRRMHNHAGRFVIYLLVSSFVVLGIHRRAEAWRRCANAADAAANLPSSDLSRGLRPVPIADQVQRLESLLSTVAQAHPKNALDPVMTLSQVCKDWPTDRAATPQSILIGPDSGTIAVTVMGDPRPFLDSWQAPSGWRVDEPRLVSMGGSTRITLTLRSNAEKEQP